MMSANNPNQDAIVPNPPADSISSLAWSPTANIFVAGSWDNELRCWEAGNAITAKAVQKHNGPVLCCNFNGDGSMIISGGADCKVKGWQLQSNQFADIGQHDQPVKSVEWVKGLNMVLSGSWDKTLKYWDIRQGTNPAHTTQLPERVFTMDVADNLCVVGVAERGIIIYDLRNPKQEFRTMESPLKFQTRTVACFPNQSGYAVGSIEGRVGIQNIDEKDANKNFAFKCHRENNNVYAVNYIAFHPLGTFATMGSDGNFNFWDKDSKQRLKQFKKMQLPITCGEFNANGEIFAYAVSYDWSKGLDGYKDPEARKNNIYLHRVVPNEIAPRMVKKK